MQILFNTFLKINVAYFLGSAKNCEPYPPPYNHYKTRVYKEPVLNVHGDMGTWGHGDMGTVNPHESLRIFVNLHECESSRILTNHHLSLSIVRSQGVMGHGHGFTLLDSWGVLLIIMGTKKEDD
jgi:hypothetical protein